MIQTLLAATLIFGAVLGVVEMIMAIVPDFTWKPTPPVAQTTMKNID